MSLVSIIILNYNHPEVIDVCLHSLADSEGNYEVVVVDNGSTDPSVPAVLRAHEAAGRIDTLVFSPTNEYFAGGNNTGVAHASPTADVFCFLNSDVIILRPDWLVKLLAWFEKVDILSLGYSNDQSIIPAGVRAEGWCLLVRRSFYVPISTDFPMPYGIEESIARSMRELGARTGLLSRRSRYIFHEGRGSTPSSAEHEAISEALAALPHPREPDLSKWYEGLVFECLDFTPGTDDMWDWTVDW